MATGARGAVVAVAALALLLTGTAVGLGVALSSGSSGRATPPPEKRPAAPDVPLAEVDLSVVTPPRTPFCDRIPAAAVEVAAGGIATTSEYLSGDSAELEPGLTDVTDEIGCVFESGQTRARVWVFTDPVTFGEAQRMVADQGASNRCEPAGTLRFGSPGTVLDCTAKGVRTVKGVGRIGDSWVHCELAVPKKQADANLVERAQRWCVETVFAMAE